MALSALMIYWFARLKAKGIWPESGDLLELGPQDILTTEGVVRSAISGFVDDDRLDQAIASIFLNGKPRELSQSILYGLLGNKSYKSADLFDKRADFAINLNGDDRSFDEFDIVTNFGTSEHVFNIGTSFEISDRLTRQNGLLLFVLPTFGYINHGFYNIHPTLYFDFARENKYKIDDIIYVDNTGTRCRDAERAPDEPPDFDHFPIDLRRDRGSALEGLVAERYAANVLDPGTRAHMAEFPSICFDYCFVALRKQRTSDVPFRPPTQGLYRPPRSAVVPAAEIELERLGPPPEAEILAIKAAIGRRDITEARRLAAQVNLDNLLNVQARRFQDFSPDERLITAEVANKQAGSPQAAISLSRAVRYLVENDIPGAFIECGVFMGASIQVMIRTLLLCGRTDRDIYLFDTFEGMPPPEDVDVYDNGEPANVTWESYKRDEQGHSNWAYAPLDDVRKRIASMGYPPERIHFIKGLVEDTLPQNAPENVALLRLDTGFYRSTKHELVHLYPRLIEGGILIVNDYGVFRSAQRATDEYIAEQKLPIFLGRVDEALRIAVKHGK